jgi:hypothetical protein
MAHLVLVTFLLICCTTGVSAQTESTSPTPTPAENPNADLEKLKNQLEILKQIVVLQKDISQAEADRVTQEKNKILNALPQPTATPLAGTATISNFTFENEVLAYRALGSLTGKIFDKVNVSGRPTLIIYNDADVRAMESYAAVLGQIRSYNDTYKLLIGGGAESASALLLGPQVGTAFLRSVVDLLALFRTDVKVEGVAIILDDDAIAARVADGLSSKFNIYNPKLLLPNMLDAPAMGGDNTQAEGLLKSLHSLQFLRSLADSTIANSLTDARTKEKLTALNKEVDKFIAALLEVDPQTKRSAVNGLYRAEKLMPLLSRGGGQSGHASDGNEPNNDANSANEPYLLYLKFIKAGGSHNTKTNLFKGTKMTETGGAIVAFNLFKANGPVTSSGVCYAYIGARNSSPEAEVLLADCK